MEKEHGEISEKGRNNNNNKILQLRKYCFFQKGKKNPELFSGVTNIVSRKYKTLKLRGNKIRINDIEVFIVMVPVNLNPKKL
jgi:hypothetical protein